jgi:hypothetical protein
MTGEYESGFDGVLLGHLPEVERLKRFDSFCRELNVLHERWDNRLTLGGRTFAEEYIRGRLSIACYFHLRAGADHIQNPALPNEGGLNIERVAVLIFRADIGDGLNRGDRNDEPVLVEVVERPNLPKLMVPSIVRLYHVGDEVGQIGQGFLYRSELAGGYKVVPFFTGRERNPFRVATKQVERDMIHGDSKVMDCVTNAQGDFGWKCCNRIELKEVLPGFRVDLDVEFAKVCGEKLREKGINLIDVAIGPLDL